MPCQKADKWPNIQCVIAENAFNHVYSGGRSVLLKMYNPYTKFLQCINRKYTVKMVSWENTL